MGRIRQPELQLEGLKNVLYDFYAREFEADSDLEIDNFKEHFSDGIFPLVYTEIDDTNCSSLIDVQINYNLNTQHIDYWLLNENGEFLASENDPKQDFPLETFIEELPYWSFDDIVRDAYDYIDELNKKE